MKSQIVKPIKSINLSIKNSSQFKLSTCNSTFPEKYILIQFAENCQLIILS